MKSWKQRLKQLKTETYALYLAYQDRRVSWGGSVFAACLVAYASGLSQSREMSP